jgi:exocyst complex protein 7
VQLTQLYKKWLSQASVPLKDVLASVATGIELPDAALMERISGLSAWLAKIPVPFDPESHPRRTYPQIRSVYLVRSLQPLAGIAATDVKRCSAVFMQLIEAFSALLEVEHKVLESALEIETPDIWGGTVAPAVAQVVETGENVLQIIKRRNDFSLIFMLFDVLEFWSVKREKLVSHLTVRAGCEFIKR